MSLPDFPMITESVLQAIADRHNLNTTSFARLPQVGLFNLIYGVGDDLILRIPRNHPRFIAAARNEAIAVPLARAAGVRTPALLLFDEERDILPVPYSLYERVPGTILEHSVSDPARVVSVWNELGHDLARLHSRVEYREPATNLTSREEKTDPRPLPEDIARAGYFTSVEARWLIDWLDRLAPAVLPAGPRCFLHGDTQAANIIVAPGSLTYRAVIDWGSCRWGDLAHDFAGVSLRAVPALLEGYREIGVLDEETIEARILWRHLQIALHQLRGQPQPQSSWAERPMGMLVDILRFFLEEPGAQWKQWSPPSLPA